MPHSLARPTLAVVFADLSGSTRLYQALGDGPASRAVGAALSLVARRVEAHGGRVVKYIGDEVMAVFRSAAAARAAILDLLDLPAREEASVFPEYGLSLKLGAHFGPVVPVGADVLGHTVNVAARLVATAGLAEALVSVALWPDGAAGRVEHLQLRGVDTPLPCRRIGAPNSGGATPIAFRPSWHLLDPAGRSHPVDQTGCVLGRSPACDVCIGHPLLSPRHLRVWVGAQGAAELLPLGVNGIGLRRLGTPAGVPRRIGPGKRASVETSTELSIGDPDFSLPGLCVSLVRAA